MRKIPNGYSYDRLMGVYEKGSISVQITGEKKGKIFDHQKRVYEGELKNLEPHGRGILFHDNGTYHEGDFKKGKRDGKGILFYADGLPIMEGKWKHDAREGKFKCYEGGHFREYKLFENDHEINCPEGKKLNPLTGNCIKDKRKLPPGTTVLSIRNFGTINRHGRLYYRGDIQKGLPNGQGTEYDTDTREKIFEGSWKNGKRDGKGTLLYDNGGYAQGTWKNNRRQGKFKIFNRDDYLVEIIPYKNDEIVQCPPNKVLNPKTGNCIKGHRSVSDVELLRHVIDTKFCATPASARSWMTFYGSVFAFHVLFQYLRHLDSVEIPGISSNDVVEASSQMFKHVKQLHHQTASAPGVLEQNLSRLGDVEDNINYQDLVLYAQYVKIWIIMYHEQTKQWECASPIFYNYMPTAIVFMRENNQSYSILYPKFFKGLSPHYFPPKKPLEEQLQRRREQFRELNEMRNRRVEEMLRQTRSSTNPRPRRLSANERLKNSIINTFFKHRWETRQPDTTQEELLIERLQHTTVSEPIEQSIEQTLQRFTRETNTWVLLYYSEQYFQFILPMTEEPPTHIYFVKKENPFHRTRQYWANPEFQLICSPSERIPKLYQPYLSVCPRRFTGMVSASLRARMDQEKKAKPKKNKAMERLRKAFKVKRR